MKNTRTFLLILFAFILVIPIISSQEKETEFKKVYITITTLHGMEGVSLEDWKATEKEYFDKVTSKIDLLLSHEFLISNIKNDFSDIKVINVFGSWEDIAKINEVRNALIEEAWPNKEERDLFFEKQNSFYTNLHSDEIYTSTSFGFPISDKTKKAQKTPFVFFIQKSTLVDDKSNDTHLVYEKYARNVFHKNDFIKGYYPQKHLWGSDSRDFVEIFVLSDTEDIMKSIDRNRDLLKKLVPEEEKRQEFLDAYESAILNRVNATYFNVPSLSK